MREGGAGLGDFGYRERYGGVVGCCVRDGEKKVTD